jgi:hypothetical protein
LINDYHKVSRADSNEIWLAYIQKIHTFIQKVESSLKPDVSFEQQTVQGGIISPKVKEEAIIPIKDQEINVEASRKLSICSDKLQTPSIPSHL